VREFGPGAQVDDYPGAVSPLNCDANGSFDLFRLDVGPIQGARSTRYQAARFTTQQLGASSRLMQ